MENHSHLSAHQHLFFLTHVYKVATVVEHLSASRFQESNEVLHQYSLSGTALTDDQVGLTRFKLYADMIEYGLVAE